MKIKNLFEGQKSKPTARPEAVTASTLSPISKKPMKRVTCAGIEAYYDPESRLVLPAQK